MGILPLRDYDRRDSTTRKEKREKERGQGIDFFLKQILYQNLLPVFRVQDSLYFCFRLISSSPSFPTMRRKGKEKRKRKEKENPQNAFSPSHPPSMRYIHKTQSPPPLPGGSSLYIQQHHISIPLIIVIQRDGLVDFI